MLALRYAWRSLSRSPGFVTMAVLALGLGLGLSTTMFAVMDAVVNPYLPYEHSDRLLGVSWRYKAPLLEGAGDPEIFEALKHHGHVFENLAAIAFETRAMRAGDESREVGVGRVEPGYFPIMRVKPVIGRVFTAADGPDVVVLSQAVWRRVFGLRQQLNGASIFLGAQAYHVVGVLPRGADHPGGALAWIPFPPEDQLHTPFSALGRLSDGVLEKTAYDELHSLGAILTSRYAPASHAPVGFNINPVRARSEHLGEIHFAMVGAALIVLLIACANLAHLVLARGMARRGELALRLALGASRSSLVGQMLLECAAITIAGAGLGALLAIWGCDVLANRMPDQISWVGLVEPRLSWRVFGWSAFAAAYSAALFGLLPAVRVAMRVNMNDPLKDASGSTTARVRHRYNVLVIAEVALALVLLMSAGLLVRTVRELTSQGDFGFDTRTLWRASVWVPPQMSSQVRAWYRRVHQDSTRVTREQVLATTTSVTGVLDAAFEGTAAPRGGAVSAENSGVARSIIMRTYAVVSATYLQVLGLPAVRGRIFQSGDGEESMVAVIDPVAAGMLYPAQDPVGHMLKLGAPNSDAGWVPIIGVARNPRVLTGLDAPPAPYVWVAAPTNAIAGSVVFRTGPHSADAVVDVRRRLGAMPRILIRSLEPYTWDRDATLGSRKFFAGVFVLMGVVSLALSALGLYSVLAYAVGQRLREFAVRVALGAEASRLYRMVLHDALVMLLAGIGIGAVAAMLATKYVDSVLQGVYRIDALSLVVAELLLLAIGFTAALVPARRAVNADPLQILRSV
ncbi:MAG TPA: ABC transporter permease [Gemmatimonadales bacterium]|jgi:predicted permease